jgi:GlcNAc-P-P-Und epimerase
MARMLVTGGAGFIGSRLVEWLLERGHDVRIYDIARSVHYPDRTIVGDIRELRPLTDATAGADTVFHLAAVHRANTQPVSLFQEVNVVGTKNVLEACRQNKCRRMIFTSSADVYPKNVGVRDESCSPRPSAPYGISKWQAEQILSEWAREDPTVHLTIIRPCVVFGENNRGNVYRLFGQVYKKRYVHIGSATNRKSICYVENLVAFMLACLEQPAGMHVFNYADLPNLSVGEIVEIAQRAMGKRSLLTGVHIPYRMALLAAKCLDTIGKIRGQSLPTYSNRIRKLAVASELSMRNSTHAGFTPPYSLQDALVRVVSYEFPN